MHIHLGKSIWFTDPKKWISCGTFPLLSTIYGDGSVRTFTLCVRAVYVHMYHAYVLSFAGAWLLILYVWNRYGSKHTHTNSSIYLSICLSIYPSIYRSIYTSIYPSIYLSVYPSVQSINQSVNQSIYLSSYQSNNQSINQSVNQSINRSIDRSINSYIHTLHYMTWHDITSHTYTHIYTPDGMLGYVHTYIHT